MYSTYFCFIIFLLVKGPNGRQKRHPEHDTPASCRFVALYSSTPEITLGSHLAFLFEQELQHCTRFESMQCECTEGKQRARGCWNPTNIPFQAFSPDCHYVRMQWRFLCRALSERCLALYGPTPGIFVARAPATARSIFFIRYNTFQTKANENFNRKSCIIYLGRG